VRAGGLIPIARQYPGAREFVDSFRSALAGADLGANSAAAYGACQILVEAVRRVGSLDRGKLRDAISHMDYSTVFGRFQVDRDGLQIGHKNVIFQWQDGKRAIVWPEELATGQARFPAPPWNQRPRRRPCYARRRGSSTSRRPSPSRFIASTVSMIARPGNVEIHQASRR
jgi:branched-chain amino acid transport system substrate-binding protein